MPKILKIIFKYALLAVGLFVIVFIALSLIPLKQTIKPITPRADTQYWQMAGGYKIAYTKLSSPFLTSHPPVIFLHGGPGGYVHSSIIARMREISLAGFDVYLYDQIGSGLSDRLEKPKDYSFDLHLANLQEIVTKHIHADRVILIGQSFGSLLAAHFAAVNSQFVHKMVLTSPGDLQPLLTAPDGRSHDIADLYPTPDSLKFRDPISVWDEIEGMYINPRIIMASVCAMIFNIKWAPDLEMDGLVNTMASKFTRGLVCNPANVLPEEGGGGGYAHAFSNWYADITDPRERIKSVSVRVLVMQGQCDQAPYGTAYEYADLFRGRYEFIENAGHEIWWDQPDIFVNAIREYLLSD